MKKKNQRSKISCQGPFKEADEFRIPKSAVKPKIPKSHGMNCIMRSSSDVLYSRVNFAVRRVKADHAVINRVNPSL
jgi:hypothetical protein